MSAIDAAMSVGLPDSEPSWLLITLTMVLALALVLLLVGASTLVARGLSFEEDE